MHTFLHILQKNMFRILNHIYNSRSSFVYKGYTWHELLAPAMLVNQNAVSTRWRELAANIAWTTTTTSLKYFDDFVVVVPAMLAASSRHLAETAF